MTNRRDLEEMRRTTREARELTARFHKDLDVIWSRRTDYSPERAVEMMIHQVFRLAQRMLGNAAARDFCARLGPLSKSELQASRKYALAREYGLAGKPNFKTRKLDRAAFATMRDFAEAAAKWNASRPGEERLGSGTTNTDNMLRDLKRMLQKKKYRDVADDWCNTSARKSEGTRLL
jgi:hypothetical protein